MIRSLAFMAASAALAIAPVAAQAAPQRTSAPVSAEESEALRGNPIIIIALIALLVALGIVALSDGNDPVSP